MGIDETTIHYAMIAIASGATKAEVRADIAAETNLRKTTIDELIQKALNESLAQGIEREDIDPSWF